MASVNKVILVGNLVESPQVKFTGDGGAVCNTSVATNEQWKDKKTGEKKEKAEFHRVVAFGRTAEVMGEYLEKGSQVFIEGKLQTRKWEDKDGVTRYTTEIVVGDMKMLGQRASGGSTRPAQQAAVVRNDDLDDDLPF